MPGRPFQFRLRTIFRLTALAGVACAAWNLRFWMQEHGDRLAHRAVELAILLAFVLTIRCLMDFVPRQ